MTKRATSLRVARAVDFANRADIPLAVDMNMAKVVAFEARFMVARVVTGQWGIDGDLHGTSSMQSQTLDPNE